jgi:hypothetical protein
MKYLSFLTIQLKATKLNTLFWGLLGLSYKQFMLPMFSEEVTSVYLA